MGITIGKDKIIYLTIVIENGDSGVWTAAMNCGSSSKQYDIVLQLRNGSYSTNVLRR